MSCPILPINGDSGNIGSRTDAHTARIPSVAALPFGCPDAEPFVSTLVADRPPRSALPKVFAAIVPLVYAIELSLVRGPLAPGTRTIAAAVTIDLTIFLPFLYWLLVVRPAGKPVGRVVAAVLLSLVGARLVLPPGQREYLHLVRYAVLPAEIVLVWWVATRVRRFSRDIAGAASGVDVPERIRAALLHAMPYRVTAEIFATELSLFWYALFTWRRVAHAPAGMRAFTTHRRSGTTAVLVALLGATAIEAIPLHFLVRGWSPRVAWTLTALSAFGFVWLLGLLRSIQLRPILVGDGRVVVRSGIRWTIDIPVDAVAAIERPRATLPRSAPHLLRASLAAQPNVLLCLDRSLVARGMYGLSHEATSVALTVDDRAGFLAALNTSCPT